MHASKAVLAAQYIRMSTDTQDLSPEIQKAAIAEYARRHGLSVIETYFDAGRSGLTVHKRREMKKLIHDVQSESCPFKTVLVYDISRWGRFQDTDASAYYEYHCRLHDVDVRYVQEPYTDVDSPLSALWKGMKRAMAAEYSRELAAKVRAAQAVAIDNGFQLGTRPCLGIGRVAVSKADGSVRPLGPDDHKAVHREHVRWVPGPDHEVAQVRRAFDLYASTEISVVHLAERLRAEGVRSSDGSEITCWMLYSLLRCEALIGNFVWGRAQDKKKRSESDPRFRRATGSLAPLIDREVFEAVQRKLANRAHHLFTREMLIDQLREALSENPRLMAKDLKKTGLACRGTYVKEFGSINEAWRAVGASPRRFDAIDQEQMRVTRLACIAARRKAEVFFKSWGVSHEVNGRLSRKGTSLLLNASTVLRLQVIHRDKRESSTRWNFPKAYKTAFHWALVIRQNDDGSPFDSLLLRRDEYFLQDTNLPDALDASWRRHETEDELAAFFRTLKGEGASVGVPCPRTRKEVGRRRLEGRAASVVDATALPR